MYLDAFSFFVLPWPTFQSFCQRLARLPGRGGGERREVKIREGKREGGRALQGGRRGEGCQLREGAQGSSYGVPEDLGRGKGGAGHAQPCEQASGGHHTGC